MITPFSLFVSCALLGWCLVLVGFLLISRSERHPRYRAAGELASVAGCGIIFVAFASEYALQHLNR